MFFKCIIKAPQSENALEQSKKLWKNPKCEIMEKELLNVECLLI